MCTVFHKNRNSEFGFLLGVSLLKPKSAHQTSVSSSENARLFWLMCRASKAPPDVKEYLVSTGSLIHLRVSLVLRSGIRPFSFASFSSSSTNAGIARTGVLRHIGLELDTNEEITRYQSQYLLLYGILSEIHVIALEEQARMFWRLFLDKHENYKRKPVRVTLTNVRN